MQETGKLVDNISHNSIYGAIHGNKNLGVSLAGLQGTEEKFSG